MVVAGHVDDEPEQARLWINATGEPPRSLLVAAPRFVVGRGKHCELQLLDDTVSWDHVELTRHGTALLATDLDSRNGTLLNGRALTRPTRLQHRDTLRVGPYVVDVELRALPRSTAPGGSLPVVLTPDEHAVAAALVMHYRHAPAGAGRPATKREIADAAHISERTVRRRLDALAAKFNVPSEPPNERPRLIAEHVLELGLDRTS